MEQLKEHHTVNEVFERLEVAAVGLARDPATRPLAAEAESHVDAIEAKQKNLRRARATRVVSTAWVTDADDKLDRDWMKLVRLVLALINGDREHTTFRKLYPKHPPHHAVRPRAGVEQAREVARVVHILRTDPDLAELASHADTLDADQQALDAQVAGRETLYQAEAVAQADLTRAVEAARVFYNGLERQLLGIFEDDKRKARRALGL